MFKSSPWFKPEQHRQWLPPWGPSANQQDVMLRPSGAHVGASMYASNLQQQGGSQSHTNVTIAGLSIHPGDQQSGNSDLRTRLRNDVFALRTDVGLA